MNCSELRLALTVAAKTGKLGTPVAARVHVQLASPTCDLPGVIDGVLRMLSPVFWEPLSSLRVRRHKEVEQWTVLLQTSTGKTVCISVGCGCRDTDSLELLIVGNHGVARLQGGGHDVFEWETASRSEIDWSSAIDEAVTSGREIPFSA